MYFLSFIENFNFSKTTAFSKILKKYEKITSRGAAKSYMRMVDNSYLGSSDEVNGLLDRAEATFIKHFANSNRRNGMKFLRPKHKTEKHRITFFSGFFSGFAIALLVAIVLLIEDKSLIDKQEGNLSITNFFPLYSFYVCIVLHMLLYAGNIYFWKCYRINYPFIFGFKQGTELGYREVFLLGSGISMLSLATFLVHLELKMDSVAQGDRKYVAYVPLGLISFVIAIMLCPFNIIYRSSRLFLIKCVFRCICAPFYEVTLPDSFLADQLTSQCVRRLCGEKELYHVYNGLRYFSTIIALVFRTAFELRKTLSWKVLALVSLATATTMNIYWDIVVDWGLLQRKSKNLYLRDKLVITRKSIYFAAMVLDVLLRFAWLELVFPIDFQSLHGNTISTMVACLEILRRGIWNFFRLENEHLNNVGKFRAFKSVPLPFSYNDEIDENDEKDD